MRWRHLAVYQVHYAGTECERVPYATMIDNRFISSAAMCERTSSIRPAHGCDIRQMEGNRSHIPLRSNWQFEKSKRCRTRACPHFSSAANQSRLLAGQRGETRARQGSSPAPDRTACPQSSWPEFQAEELLSLNTTLIPN